jgi:alkylation response protein AidB-like acyl-CoA dehydrogenase
MAPQRLHGNAMSTIPQAELLSRVRSLTPMIRRACVVVDRTRELPLEVVDALREAEVFRLLAPRTLGGAEIDPLTFLRVVEEVSYADGSAGWCTMIGGSYAVFGGMLPHPGAVEVFGDSSTIAAGAFRPDPGAAREVEGGYRISGRWQFGSGSSHATWFVGGAAIYQDDEPVLRPNGRPLVREFFFPAANVEVVDTWESTGLRGTASHDYQVADVFVPEERTFWFQDPPIESGALYRMPPIAMFVTFIAAVPLGIARRAIEAFVELATTKVPSMSQSVLADKPTVQASLGRASALRAASSSYLERSLAEVWERVERGEPPTLADRAELWLASAHAAHSAHAAIDMLYTAAGASAVYAASPLDRCLRDARTAIQHVGTQELNFELAGRHRLKADAATSIWSIDYRGEG